jgi:hypothetical protein
MLVDVAVGSLGDTAASVGHVRFNPHPESLPQVRELQYPAFNTNPDG